MNGRFVKGDPLDDLSGLSDKPIVLFPAGKYTQMLIHFNKPKQVLYVCDNAHFLWGTTIDGVPVVPPHKLTQVTEDFYVVVTSSRLAHDFRVQLQSLGVLGRCEFVLCDWDADYVKRFYDPFTFEDRRRHHNKMLIVLAGYKEKLWDIVFKRIERFTPFDIDVCVVSSGKYVDKLCTVCEANSWSYLSTQRNSLTLTQNIAIKLHPSASYIYKLDEDMFICEGFFDGLMEAFTVAETQSRYRIGLVAPLIPVNPHGNVRFMEKIGCLEAFEARFGKAYYDFKTHFYTKTEETVFLWEQTLPLDVTARQFRAMPFSYFICPNRLSIGAILFKRAIWEEMNGFSADEITGLGEDERNFARHCLLYTHYYSFVMAENVLAGHYSFGTGENPALLDELYENHKDLFDIMNE